MTTRHAAGACRNSGETMKLNVQHLIASAIALFVSCGNAMANSCGAFPLDPCEVPEPGSLALIVGAIGAAALIAKFRK